MNSIKKVLKRPLLAIAAFGFFLAATAPAFTPHVSADQILDRSIKLSSAIASDTGVTYDVEFTLDANAALGIAIDFCSDSPLYEDTCTAPAGMDASGAAIGSQTGSSGWTIQGSPTASHIEAGGASVSATTTINIAFTGITNPSTTASFYARIYTYALADPDWAAVNNAGSDVDFGGIAMSTVDTINITARVQESLSICTSAIDISGGNYGGVVTDIDCSFATAPDIVIGHGSPTQILEAGIADNTPAYFQLSTNATTGAVVSMKSTNTCANGGLSSGDGTVCDIPGQGAAPALLPIATNDPGFGLYVEQSQTTATVGSSTGTITPDPSYNTGNDPTLYGLDGTEATSTYGSVICSTAGPVSQVNTELNFGATAGLTTPAGIYTVGESLIATGTF